MEREQIESLLEKHISLYKHLGIHFLEINSVRAHLSVELGKNLNHKGTAFGGSLFNAAIVAAYSLVLTALREHEIFTNDVVVAKAEIRYIEPVSGDFTALCSFNSGPLSASGEASQDHADEACKNFIQQFRANGRARVHLKSQILFQNKLCAELVALFIVKDEKNDNQIS